MKFYILAIVYLGFHFSEAERFTPSPWLFPPIGDIPPQLNIKIDGLKNLSIEDEYRKIYFQARKMKPFREQVTEAKVKLAQ